MGKKKASSDGQATVAKTPEQKKQERRDRFVRLAERRVLKALKALTHVANLSNKSGYEYTDDEALKIKQAICGGYEMVADAFTPGAASESRFTLFG